MTFKLRGVVVAMGLAAGLMAALPIAVQAAECGTDKTIDIAEMNWPSAAALAHIHAIILEKGFGCSVEIVGGDTVPTSASMLSKGVPALAPELWTGTIQDAWDKGVANGTVSVAGVAISDGAVEGWWIPTFVAEANPGLKRVEDLPEYWELFKDADDPSQGRFYGCPPGWGCEIINTALFEAFELEDSFNLFSPGSGGNLDAAITRAFIREEPIAFYYWGPTSIMGKYAMTKLEMPGYDEAIHACNADPACEPKGKSAFPTPPVIKGVATWLLNEAPAVADYLKKSTLTNVEISRMLSWGDDNKAGARETAENFLATEVDLWSQWVSADAAEAIKASM